MVAEYVQGIMQKGISRFARELKRPNDEIQLLISWDSEVNKPRFRKMVKDLPNEDITFNNVLGVKFDILNREEMVTSFITKTMDTYSQELQCGIEHLFILISLTEDLEEQDELKLYLYKGGVKVKELQLEQLLT